MHHVRLAGVEEVMPLIDGADTVVHLAGVPDEAPLSGLLDGNVMGARHVLEAARRTGVGRVVPASSNRLTGCYPAARRVSAEMPPRPGITLRAGLAGRSPSAVRRGGAGASAGSRGLGVRDAVRGGRLAAGPT
ncbi:NAD-dependent epimerase/dehydratase family protein [Planobispora longispora]|uniref:NAD-dependent epimerase/dehydratase domain-containing protein n=1 Tax=Planobispora longispora TaxID=28887 RepID=A0A8J3W779_9ACTN|nr:NAD-dependent epimerase/dehydratase family protein [Planobispora longispora]GIH77566.1 hypothetical protein Plo01_39950 [Planobispora longispora]